MIYTNENGKRIKYSYDQAESLTKVVDMENSSNTLESYEYDVYMRPAKQTEGNAVTTLTYDGRDRVTSGVTKNTGGTKLAQTDYAYTINTTGLLTTATVQGDVNAVSYSTSVQQDVLGRTVAEINRQGEVTSYTYDCAENVIKIVPPDANGTYNVSYTCDHAGNVLTETETGHRVDTSTKSYTYDMPGRMTSSTDGEVNTTKYTYTRTDWVSEIETPFSGTRKGKT